MSPLLFFHKYLGGFFMKVIMIFVVVFAVTVCAQEKIEAGGVSTDSLKAVKKPLKNKYNPFEVKDYEKNIGVAAGFVSGYGFSYRKWMGGKWAVQITGFPYYSEKNYDEDPYTSYSSGRDSGYSKEGRVSFGVIGLKKLASLRELRVLSYFGGGIHGIYTDNNYYYWDEDYSYGNYDTLTGHTVGGKKEARITLGGGMGGELQLWRLIGTVVIGIRGYYDVFGGEKGLGPSIEAAFLFGL